MLADAIFRFDTTFDVYKRLALQDPTTGEVTQSWLMDRSDKGLVIPGSQGLVYVATRLPIDRYSLLRNVKDRNTNAVFAYDGNEYDMYVVESNPSYDALGSITGWRSTLRRDLPPTRTGGGLI